MERFAYYNTALGRLEIGWADGGAITRLRWVEEADHPHMPAPISEEAAGQVRQYLDGVRRQFALPLAPQGTDFQWAVWRALMDIPYGKTATYGHIAEAIGRPGAARAVGAAAARNPVWLVIPCHRCVGRDGALTGYAGGVWRKARLLALEKGKGGPFRADGIVL